VGEGAVRHTVHTRRMQTQRHTVHTRDGCKRNKQPKGLKKRSVCKHTDILYYRVLAPNPARALQGPKLKNCRWEADDERPLKHAPPPPLPPLPRLALETTNDKELKQLIAYKSSAAISNIIATTQQLDLTPPPPRMPLPLPPPLLNACIGCCCWIITTSLLTRFPLISSIIPLKSRAPNAR